MLQIRSKTDCRWDLVSLGEVMLRLDPGDDRIHTTRSFRAWEGGGDFFASGLIYGFLMGHGLQRAVECGAAHGTLTMTTLGDTSIATLAEVERVMKGASARVSR
jgi:hypothetical protein